MHYNLCVKRDPDLQKRSPTLIKSDNKVFIITHSPSLRRMKPVSYTHLDVYKRQVHDNTIFSRYSIYPEKGMTRAMMTHLAASIINQ